MPVTAIWNGKTDFRVDYPSGESILLSGAPAKERPATGPAPMSAVLAALSGCTGVDVISILRKMRQEPESFHIDVLTERRDFHPKVYTHITLVYHLEGSNLTEAGVKRAVHLSQDKFCSVSAMLRPMVELDYKIILNGAEIANTVKVKEA